MKTLKIPEKSGGTKGEGLRETKPEECGRRKMEEKRPLNGKKKNGGFGTNLDRSEECRGARTGTTRRTLGARRMPKGVRAFGEKADTNETFRRNEGSKGEKAGLNRPWDPVL